MAKINDGTLKDWKDGDKVTSDLYEADREILRAAINDTDAKANANTTTASDHTKRITDLEYNVTGTVVPMTFKELGMQNLTFDDIKLGYVDKAIEKAWKPSLDGLTIGVVEEFTATDGQIIINLTNSYTPGSFQLTVEIDGVPQDETSYTETSTTSITLSEALVAGQRVVVTIGKVDPNVDARFSSLTTQMADLTTNVKSFGAKGDGVTNDYQAIQNAINSGASIIFFPKGRYKINTALNITNRNDKPISLIGVGWSQTDTINTSTIEGNTGGIIIDTTGSQYVTIEGMRLYSDNTFTNPSTIGILIARSTTVGYAQFHHYKRLFIFLTSKPNATSMGTVGILNITGEHFDFEHGFVIADLPLAMMSTNVLNISSHYVTIGDMPSMTFCNFKQVGFRPYTQAAVMLWGTKNVKFDNCYYSPALNNPTTVAIVIEQSCNDIVITGQIEEFASALQINGDCTNITLDVFVSEMTSSYITVNSGISVYNPKFSVNQDHGFQQDMLICGDTNVKIYGGEIIIQPNQHLKNTPSVNLYGTNINYCVNSDPSNDIIVSSSSNYTVNNSKIVSSQIGDNGYIKYSNGLCEQWVHFYYDAPNDTDKVINLPIPFNNSCDNVIVSTIAPASVTASLNGTTKSTVTVRCSATGVNIYLKAIGH
jgi:hypothetical protein